MLTSRYMASVKNLPAIMKAIQDGVAPPKFTVAHLKSIGFRSSNDTPVIPLLKDLRFLDDEGTPKKRYHDYRDRSRAKTIMGEALREAYEDLFHVKERPTEADRQAITGKFKATHNASDRVAESQAMTFFALLKLADLDGVPQVPHKPNAKQEQTGPDHAKQKSSAHVGGDERSSSLQHAERQVIGLRYNIEIHLPATKDAEVYNAIFKSMKEHLIEH